MCDWWFTETAVLIDTAGRYTTQDSDSAVDKAGWLAFLGLLKRTRARQPLNGVLVAIALSDIAAAPASERLAHARAIRRRVKELYDQLGVHVPVYVLFTKADLIAGFTEFFDDLDRERRGQVWGISFPLNKTDAGTAGLFGGEFRHLVERLNQRLLDRLQTERSPERRTLIAGFPAQAASLAAPLGEFLTDAFGGSRLDPAPVLRGAYLSLGHAGRRADRSPRRRDGTQLRHRRAAHSDAAPATGPQLFSQPAAEGRDLRRGDAGIARSGAGPPQPVRARRCRRGRVARHTRRRRRAGSDASGEPGRAR